MLVHHKRQPGIRKVLLRARHAGLVVHAKKSSFCATVTEYFRYVLTKDGIEHTPKKVKALHCHCYRVSNYSVDIRTLPSTTEISG